MFSRIRPWYGTVGRCLGLLALLVLRVLWLRAYPLNSDEPQHAHVAWSIGQGDLPYRDVFDNHGPLFSAIYAPLMHAMGPRSDILEWLRLAVVPWYLLALVATWCLARRLYSRGIADASVVLVGLTHAFFIKMGEFRTDDLWTALWLSALATAVYARGRASRWALVGLLLGAALSVSQKTLPLSCVALLAAACVWAIPWHKDRRALLKGGGALLAGCLVVPGAFALYLAIQHDLGPAWYDLVAYNLSATGRAAHADHRLVYGMLAVAVAMATTTWLRRVDPGDAPTHWRLFLGIHGLLFASFIWLVWPLPTAQDFLPVIPTIFVSLIGLVGLFGRSAAWPRSRAVALVAVLAAVEFVLLIEQAPPWRDTLAYKEGQLRTVLACTSPDDTVMDAKSGAIFRPRPYHTVLESIALQRFERGLKAEDIVPALVAHRTMTVIVDRLPPATRAFIAQNYLSGTANVFMAGKQLVGRDFDVTLAGTYTVTDGASEVAVVIDGRPAASRWQLSEGHHSLDTLSHGALDLVWSPAWMGGWRPVATPGSFPPVLAGTRT